MNEHERAARITELRAQIETMRAELIRLARETAADVAGLTGEERAAFIGLHSSTEPGTLGTQMQVEKSWGAAIAAAKRKPKWPFARALDKAGISLPEWARLRGAKVENVKSWLKNPGKGGRPVPRVWAERIAKEFPKVPANPESWPNGIRD